MDQMTEFYHTSTTTPLGSATVLPRGQIYGEPLVEFSTRDVPTYMFKPHGKLHWRIFDPNGGLVYEIRHVENVPVAWDTASAYEDPFNLYEGQHGPCVLSLHGRNITMRGWKGVLSRGAGIGELTFAWRDHLYAWHAKSGLDELVVYPSKEIVVEGDVNLISGEGELRVLDLDAAPHLRLVVASYARLLTSQLAPRSRSADAGERIDVAGGVGLINNILSATTDTGACKLITQEGAGTRQRERFANQIAVVEQRSIGSGDGTELQQ